MASISQLPPSTPPPELHNGDRMTQKEFHAIYAQMPDTFKAELIGGIVYVTSPLKDSHGTRHVGLSTLFGVYQANTPGVRASDNATVILGDEDEPQPDLHLRILSEYGGQSRETEDEYIEGAPEMVAEVAHSSRAIDLGDKRNRYAYCGVREYLVVCLRPREVRWFDLKSGQEFTADAEGVFKSVLFPGLWVHAESLLQLDYKRMLAVLNQGLATPEHAAFVAKLAAARTPPAVP